MEVANVCYHMSIPVANEHLLPLLPRISSPVSICVFLMSQIIAMRSLLCNSVQNYMFLALFCHNICSQSVMPYLQLPKHRKYFETVTASRSVYSIQNICGNVGYTGETASKRHFSLSLKESI